MKAFLDSMNEYISLETAKLAKEKGYNQNPYLAHNNKCMAYYPEFTDGSGKIHLNSPLYNLEHVIAIAPTQSVLQKWLRDTQGIHIEITKLGNMWDYNVISEIHSLMYNSYEDALEAGLYEALKLITV